MRETIEKMIEISKSSEFKKVNIVKGNIHLWDVIFADPKYQEVKNRLKEPTKRGRKSHLSQDINVILSLVTKLYADNGEVYTTERTLKNAVRAGMDRYFFDLHEKNDTKKHHWIDVMSALNSECNLFGGKNVDFSTFLREYNNLYLKIDNKKMEPFYPRSISDICAVYTIYNCKTCSFYIEMKKRLEQAKKEGMALSKENKANYSKAFHGTDYIREHFVIHTFNNYVKANGDVDVVESIDEANERINKAIESASDFIKNNPKQFDLERHYCIIKELLNDVILPSEEFDFSKSTVMEIFNSNSSSLADKDKNINRFEYDVFVSIMSALGGENAIRNEDMVNKVSSLFVDSEDGDDCDYESGINIDNVSCVIMNKDWNFKSKTASALSTLSMLRHMAILIKVKKTFDKNNNAFAVWAVTPKEELINTINNYVLSRVGLLNLMSAHDTYCTDTSKTDWCISKMIDDHYKKIEKSYCS